MTATGADGREHTLVVSRRRYAFVFEYCKDHNAAAAVVRCGYATGDSYSRGRAMLRDPVLRLLIEDRERQLSNQAMTDEAWVLDQLKTNARRGIEAGDLSVANKALELIGKQIGMFVDRTNVRVAFEQIERVERRIVDPVIDLEDYRASDERRRG